MNVPCRLGGIQAMMAEENKFEMMRALIPFQSLLDTCHVVAFFVREAPHSSFHRCRLSLFIALRENHLIIVLLRREMVVV